ncbi:hypothetical protein [Microseira wollei]|uniref:hypothetical protein n=1 Tax=Microseira wollei TaxID=467598 RepID=UPI001CFD8BFF|nr:hypothetical protein [Microseira wollei]
MVICLPPLIYGYLVGIPYFTTSFIDITPTGHKTQAKTPQSLVRKWRFKKDFTRLGRLDAEIPDFTGEFGDLAFEQNTLIADGKRSRYSLLALFVKRAALMLLAHQA